MIDSIEVRCDKGTLYKGTLRMLVYQMLERSLVAFTFPMSVYVNGELETVIDPRDDQDDEL